MTSDPNDRTNIYRCKLAIMKHMYQFYDKNHTILELESILSSYYDDVVRQSIDLLLKEGYVQEMSSANLPNPVAKSHLAYKITTRGMYVYSKLQSPEKEDWKLQLPEKEDWKLQLPEKEDWKLQLPKKEEFTYISSSSDYEQRRLKKKDRRGVIAFFTIFAIVFIIFVILVPLLA